MTRARGKQVRVESTRYYHCISRCVRRAFLCGEDRVSGKSFEHRKAWVEERMRALSSVFAVDLCAYAVMSNHFHVVVRLAPERVAGWDDDEVLERLGLLFKPTAQLIRQLSPRARKKALAPWRARLADLSWYMRCLNEHIARRANKEDGCTGRFWEGRFKSQALLDEGALLTCMSYVDLNPVRAGLAKRLEDAELTSIRARLREAAAGAWPGVKSVKPKQAAAKKAHAKNAKRARATDALPQAPLVPFAAELDALAKPAKPARANPAGAKRRASSPSPARIPLPAPHEAPIPMSFAAYVALLEEVGKALRADKKTGTLSVSTTSALERLGIAPDRFLTTLRGYSKSFFTMVGHAHAIDTERERLGVQKVKGSRAAVTMYAEAA